MNMQVGQQVKICFPNKPIRAAIVVNIIPAGIGISEETVNKFYEGPPTRYIKGMMKAQKHQRFILQFTGSDHYAVIPDVPRNEDYILY